MSRWYLIYTKPCAENTASAHLSRQGFEVYFPRVLQRVRRAGRWAEQIAALFPRYLFVGVDDERQSLAPVRSTVGISGLVRFGAQYAPVPDQILQDLQSRADPISGLHRIADAAPFARGAPVQIATGAFANIEGVFERAAGADRVLVLLKVLGQSVTVKLPLDAVVPRCA